MRMLVCLISLLPTLGSAEPIRVFTSVLPVKTFVDKIGGEHEEIRVVYVQPQFDKRQARQVAQAIGGVVIAVDPLAEDYVDNLRRVGREFARALQP